MELKSDFLQNENFKNILDSIKFYSRVIDLKKKFGYKSHQSYDKLLNIIPSKKVKSDIISKILSSKDIVYKHYNSERIFSICTTIKKYSLGINLEYDEVSIRGSLSFHFGENCHYKDIQSLLGGLEYILVNFYQYEVRDYGFAVFDEHDILVITEELLGVYNDFVAQMQSKI